MITFLKLFVNTINLFFPVGVFAFFSETLWGDDVCLTRLDNVGRGKARASLVSTSAQIPTTSRPLVPSL